MNRKSKWMKGVVLTNTDEVIRTIRNGTPLYVRDRWTSAAWMRNWSLIQIENATRSGHVRLAIWLGDHSKSGVPF